MEKADADFQGRTEQLSLISNYFNNQIASGQSARVYLSGPETAGKTELAKKFTAKFHQDENANCIWIDGNRASVQKSFTRFVESVLPSNLLSDSPTKISAVVSLLQEHVFKHSQNSWLFVLDGIDDSESVQFLSSLLKQFSKFPPVQDPLILVTSQKQIGDPNIRLNHWTENNFKYLSLHITSLSSRFVKNCLNDQGDMVRHVMYRLASVFDSFIAKNQKEEKRVKLISLCVSLISLVAYFVTDEISESYLLNIWASLVNQPDTNFTDRRDILDRFRTTLGIFLRQPGNSNVLDSPKPAVVAIFRQILVVSDPFRKYLGRAISVPSITEESVIQKIFVIVLRNYKDNANSDNESGQNVKHLVNKVLYDDALLKLCSVGVSNYSCSSNNVPLLGQVHDRFATFFGRGHDESMTVLSALVVALMKQSDYANAVDKCRNLYDLAKKRCGLFHDTTYAAYTNLVQCYKVVSFEEGIKLREEMVVIFEAEFGPHNIRTIEERYNLAVAFGDKDPAKCKKRLSELAPICKQYHFVLYQKMEGYINQPSGAKTKVNSSSLQNSFWKING